MVGSSALQSRHSRRCRRHQTPPPPPQPPPNGNGKSRSGVVDAQMKAAESETPRAPVSQERSSLCRPSPTWNCHRLETPTMTIWEFEVFSWSAYKTNRGDLLIKLDFHSEEKFGSLLPAFISIVAQSRRTGAVGSR